MELKFLPSFVDKKRIRICMGEGTLTFQALRKALRNIISFTFTRAGSILPILHISRRRLREVA